MIWAIIRSSIEKIHYWEGAIGEVEFLKYPHRHLFYVELWIEQKNAERDIEYITEKRSLDEYLRQMPFRGGFSCEDIASDIKYFWSKKYPDRKIKVFVFEDNENGTMIE
jgi:hypothetical protein